MTVCPDWLWRGQFPHAASEAALEDARPAAHNATSPAENRWNHGIAVHAASHLQLRRAELLGLSATGRSAQLNWS
jgi:hypothetical protein